MTRPSFLDWLHGQIGRNWVVARRTERILRRYGDDVVTLSPARYRKLVSAYESLHGPRY